MLRFSWIAGAGAFAFALSAAAAGSAPKQDSMLGAGEAVKRLVVPAAIAPGSKKDEVVQLLRDLDAYVAMPYSPTASVADWMTLYERWPKVRSKVDRNNPEHMDLLVQRPLAAQSLLARLPPPEAWPRLEQRLRKVRAAGSAGAGLDLLGALLGGGSLSSAFGRARTKVAQLPNEKRALAERRLRAIELLTTAGDDAPSILKAFELEVEERAAAASSSRLQAPDLVTLVGREKATALLTRALLLPATSVSVPVGDDTRVLAQDILLEKATQLRVPHWGLVRAPKAKAVYEALSVQFPEASKSTESAADVFARLGDGDDGHDVDYGDLYEAASERTEAQLHYLVGLIVEGESTKAEQLASRLAKGDGLASTGSALRELRKAGYGTQLYGFFKALLERNPTLGAWSLYFELAAENGKTDEALAVVERALRDPALSTGAKRELKQQRVSALLAADKVSAAIEEIDRLVTAGENQGDALVQFRSDLAMRLVEIARLLENQKALERGIRYLQVELGRTWPQEARHEQHALRLRFVKALRASGRLAESERLLLDALETSQRGSEAQMMSAFAMADPMLVRQLVELAALYLQAERWQDVLTLAEGMPAWGAVDLAQLGTAEDSGKVPLQYIVARALIGLGDATRAQAILETVISRRGDFDPAYEVYVDMRGEGAVPFLEGVYRRDRFEERPLIWKAVALVKAGKAQEAEVVARQAISVDPSDGEQGVGHRMRAYAILTDALQQRGQLEAAESYRGAIRAIRISERADALRQGGMHSRAIALYREALTQFSDAYCIQSRLAVELSRSGRHAEAEQHYRRAYELMPESFGRVESHCFGCEKVFETKNAQSVAEQVFQGLLKKTPDKAQVHYLMGYLRYEQSRYGEAIEFFRTAVAIDPEYLNAWKKLSDVGGRIHMSRSERDIITLKILALDPQMRHSSPDLSAVVDLRGLWRGVSAAKAAVPINPATLMPLKASATRREEALEQLPEPMRRSAQMYETYMATGAETNKIPLPGTAVANTRAIGQVAQLIDQGD